MSQTKWQLGFSILVLILLLAVAGRVYPLWTQLGLALVLAAFFTGTYLRFGGRPTLPNAITGIRSAAAVVLLVIAPLLGNAGAYTVFGIAAAAALTDFLDGRVARHLAGPTAEPAAGPAAFGAMWDAETDAAFMVSLSVVVTNSTPVGPWVLALGAIRYLFAIAFLPLAEDPPWPKAFSRFSKWVCGIAVGTLVGALYPAIPLRLAVAANAVSLTLLAVSFGWELGLRAGGWGMLRTLLIYYGIPFRKRRLTRFYAGFIGPGDLAFDIGAHVGNRIRAWRGLGARAVGLEPQPACVRLLRQFYGNDPLVTIRPVAVGAEEGRATLFICDAYPTLSTIASDWINEVKAVSSFAHVRWNRREEIAVTTLDALIAAYGVPAFTKIDVEGHEPQVLAGLSRPLPALSFEFLPASISGALACIDRLEELGNYEYNYSLVETARLREPGWLSPQRMRKILTAMAPTAPSGDVYARLPTDGERR